MAFRKKSQITACNYLIGNHVPFILGKNSDPSVKSERKSLIIDQNDEVGQSTKVIGSNYVYVVYVITEKMSEPLLGKVLLLHSRQQRQSQ